MDFKLTQKPIEGYEGKYYINSDGSVLSTPSDGKPPRVLKQEVIKRDHTNYRRVSLSKNGQVTRFQVHRLVAKAFIPLIKDKPDVNHIDNNGENNKYTNLEWCTHSENMLHAGKQGRLRNSTQKAQQASLVSKLKLTKIELESYFGKEFGYIKVLNTYTEKQTKTSLRYLLHCMCTRCNSGQLLKRERFQLNNNSNPQCQSCGSKYGGTGKRRKDNNA